MLTYLVLALLAVLFGAVGMLLACAMHPWYASDCFCFMLGSIVAVLVRAIEEAAR